MHHRRVEPENVLGKWLDIQKARTTPDSKPTLILLRAPGISLERIQNIAKASGVGFINVALPDATKQLNDMMTGNRIVLCSLPALHKCDFDQLVTLSNLPALGEGANSTTRFLTNKHAYLSLLPNGDTPLPLDMGDPFEALIVNAFSYKLRNL